MSGTQVLGIVDITWNGVKLPVESGATFQRGGLRNTTVIAGRQTFRSQKMMQSKVSATIPFQAGQSMTDITGTSAGELQFSCDTGQNFVIPTAWLVEDPQLTTGDGGKLKLDWEGGEALELGA
jgi:hypothetical protein